MLKILRAIVGVVIGIGYGYLVGAITLRLLLLTFDPRYPGPMIPDKNGWARFTALMVTVVTSVCASLAGITIGLTGANAVRGAVIGGSFGAGFFLMFTVLEVTNSWSWLMREPAQAWPMLLRNAKASFVILVVGLPLVGLITGFITSKLKGWR